MAEANLRMDRKLVSGDAGDPGAEDLRPARFALLRHDWPEPHRDLILEWPGERGRELLATWALYPEHAEKEAFPADRATSGRAVPLPPHRAVYLEYEGPVSGNRGHVSRECAGVVVRVERGASIRIDLHFEQAGGLVEGTLRISRAAVGARSLSIRVSHTHERPAASCMVFAWEPSSRTRPADEVNGAEAQGR